MLTPGTLLQGRYRVVRHLASGGMGAVYEAMDERLDALVALKETAFDDEELRAQFEREARLLARLHHPALPRVSDHFTEGDGQFLIMQFISGEDLEAMRRERGGSFPASQVLAWADQLLDALDYLHTQTPPVIHRDIKPHNLKLGERGQIMLLDFGLAKGYASRTSPHAPAASIVGGTPAYAPLEQMQGAGTDARSDIYSLAATLYHLLTGVVPSNALARADAAINGEPDPLRPADELSAQVSKDVAAVLRQAMALRRDQRISTASAMRRALREADKTARPHMHAGGMSTVAMLPQPTDQPAPSEAEADAASGTESAVTETATPTPAPPASGRTRRTPLIVGVAALLLVGVVGVWLALTVFHKSASRVADLKVGSKDFTESVILAEALAQTLEAHGLKIERTYEVGGNLTHELLVAGEIDAYPEYTGTSLMAILKHPPSTDARSVYEQVKREYAERFNVEVGPQLGFENTYAILVRGDEARRLNLKTISDAAPHAKKWRAGFGQDFMSRRDGYESFARAYNLQFASRPREIDLSLSYRALAEGQVDIIAGNSTDGLIAKLNLIQLEDDRHYFPPYEAVFLLRRDTLERLPAAREALQKLAGSITTDEMRRLNYEVDGGKRATADVVREWRAARGL
jgi:glycine betaine/choline ABC-type transport system substrate-binding protein